MDLIFPARPASIAKLLIRKITTVGFCTILIWCGNIQDDFDKKSHATTKNIHPAANLFDWVNQLADGIRCWTDVDCEPVDEYWQYYFDCDRWGIVLTPNHDQPKTKFDTTSLIADTRPTVNIAEPELLHVTADKPNLAIEELVWAFEGFFDEADILLMLAEIEMQEMEVEVVDPSSVAVSLPKLPVDGFDASCFPNCFPLADHISKMKTTHLTYASNGNIEKASPLPWVSFQLIIEMYKQLTDHPIQRITESLSQKFESGFGQTLLFQIGADILFNAEMEFNRIHLLLDPSPVD